MPGPGEQHRTRRGNTEERGEVQAAIETSLALNAVRDGAENDDEEQH